MSTLEVRICLWTAQEFVVDASSRVRFASREAFLAFREAAYRNALDRALEAAKPPRVVRNFRPIEGTSAGTTPGKQIECAPDFRRRP